MSAASRRDLGVVIARFQTHELTLAHQHLLRQVSTRVGRVLALLGCPPIVGTKRNPLEFLLRSRMVTDFWEREFNGSGPELTVLPCLDCQSDAEWARRVDQTIAAVNVNGPAKIFCGPDGAGPIYQKAGGAWPVEMLDAAGAHASVTRYNIAPRYSEDFRAGVIYGIERRFVNPFQTVDIAVCRKDEVLLAQKVEDGGFYRFVGGFVDAADKSLEAAAAREAREETGLEISPPRYVGSFQIQDWRYRNGPEQTLTALFRCEYLFGTARGQDDIDAVKWVPLVRAHEFIHPIHSHLLDAVLSQTGFEPSPTTVLGPPPEPPPNSKIGGFR